MNARRPLLRGTGGCRRVGQHNPVGAGMADVLQDRNRAGKNRCRLVSRSRAAGGIVAE